ncbi:unnamed protein product [Onchocerca ochengi]|uniref:FERM domain-containing protein n=1 Tax=Onchocerca ochengi TaxID=42157 RepID=A0A182EW35_ONCOC|nr:unnamed protein product [Onchocerca ochengi]
MLIILKFYCNRNPTDPDHPRAKDNVRGYENLLKNDGVQSIDMRRDIPPINNIREENDFDEGVMLMYEALCRQEVPVNVKIQSRLYCYYKTDRPYLRLAPFKVEIVRQNTLAALFYDIMTDEEARILRILTEPKACSILLALYYGIPYPFSNRKKDKAEKWFVFTWDLAESISQ